MDIVREITELIQRTSIMGRQKRLISGNRLNVTLKRLFPPSDAEISVRRHVNQMTQIWSQFCQAIRILSGPERVAGCFRNMDIKVDSRRIVRVPIQHAFKQFKYKDP